MRRGRVWGLVCGGDYGGGAYPAPPPHLASGDPWGGGLRTYDWEITKACSHQRAFSINYLGLTQLKTNHKTNFGK